jgi:hypothetical protein
MFVKNLGAIVTVATLMGCSTYNTTVVVQAAPQTAVPAPLAHCVAPAGTGPFEALTKPTVTGHIDVPARARAEHVVGCAGVRFRLGADGTPHDIAVLTEFPAGYGFAAAAVEAIAESRWAAKDDQAWRYIIYLVQPGKPNPTDKPALRT